MRPRVVIISARTPDNRRHTDAPASQVRTRMARSKRAVPPWRSQGEGGSMPELELVRLHEDGDHLVLRAPDGQESTLPISDALRAAVRRDRPRTEALPTQGEATLRPRELQARLRAGASAEELAVEAGIPVAHVQRYEWPVMAERDHVIRQVRAHRL